MGTKRKAGINGREIAEEKATGSISVTTNATVEKHSLTDKTTAMEPSHSNGLSPDNKDSEVPNIVVQQSGHLKSSVIPLIQEVEPVVELVNHVEKEKGKPNNLQQVNTAPLANERDSGDKAENLDQAVDKFKSEVITQKENVVYSAEFSYKSLYISSQKKIEDLMEEKRRLAMKLEFTLGKIEAYEKMKDVIGVSKDVIFVPNLGKATEAMVNLVNLSPQTTMENCTSPIAAPAPVPNAFDADEHTFSPKKKKKKKNYKNASVGANDQKTCSKQKKKKKN